MTVLVALDTETGIIRRYVGSTATHAGGLTHDPEDADKTREAIETFRHTPPDALKIGSTGRRTFEDALREQRLRLNP